MKKTLFASEYFKLILVYIWKKKIIFIWKFISVINISALQGDSEKCSDRLCIKKKQIHIIDFCDFLVCSLLEKRLYNV